MYLVQDEKHDMRGHNETNPTEQIVLLSWIILAIS